MLGAANTHLCVPRDYITVARIFIILVAVLGGCSVRAHCLIDERAQSVPCLEFIGLIPGISVSFLPSFLLASILLTSFHIFKSRSTGSHQKTNLFTFLHHSSSSSLLLLLLPIFCTAQGQDALHVEPFERTVCIRHSFKEDSNVSAMV